MADQVIGYLQDTAAHVLKTYGDSSQPPHPEVVHEVLRQPIFSNNQAEKPETCLLDSQFQALAIGGHVGPCLPPLGQFSTGSQGSRTT